MFRWAVEDYRGHKRITHGGGYGIFTEKPLRLGQNGSLLFIWVNDFTPRIAFTVIIFLI
jgi:hypothetical protein